MAVCLLGAFAAVPKTGAQAHAVGIIWGVTVGLALAHWFAFRVSARLVGAGSVRPHDVESAGAQLAGAAGVALLASVPVVLVPESVELELVELLLAAFIALVGSPWPVAAARRGLGRRSMRSRCWWWPSPSRC